MGKPYFIELNGLKETYSWALDVPIEPLVAAVSSSANLPLVAVGSGGSFSAAHLACALHQHYTGMVSRPITPFELVSSPIHLRSLGIMIISSGGSNTDIISAFGNALLREPRRCIVLCLRGGSSLSRLAQSYRYIDLFDLNPPSVKDGFLATNSLLAFSVLLVRAYDRAYSLGESLPREFDSLLDRNHSSHQYLQDLSVNCSPLWSRETLIVLYGPSVSSAAIDLESKFSEAALGNIQPVDFRNFAHGRHHWLAKRESRTGIVAIFSEKEREIAEKTLRLIPSSVPIVRICPLQDGPAASVAAIVAVLHLVGAAGNQRGIDPGRPGVPTFGRKIYSLRVLRTLMDGTISPDMNAIARKVGCDVQSLQNRQDVVFWQKAYHQFVKELEEASFGAVLFDYDGTLCDERDRFSGMREDIVRHLTRLLKAGVALGIATGRGKSVREDLRRVLPKRLWRHVYLGYYNGADVANLCDDEHPDSSPEPSGSLRVAAEAILKHPVISSLATCEFRKAQVSVQPKSAASAELAWRVLLQLAQIHSLKAVRSSHSIDLVRQDVSKLSLLHHLQGKIPKGTHVLSIGDKGQWPGNDFDLLSTPYSLSVNEVSADPSTCWNLVPPGPRGGQATIAYLNALQLSKRTFTVVVQKLASSGFSRRKRR
jgi:hydroxymethylpyrimidine pyrophosphatase-like HAD family hydrolase/fructoselysine-6-P-deglycase FrlB-like protein